MKSSKIFREKSVWKFQDGITQLEFPELLKE